MITFTPLIYSKAKVAAAPANHRQLFLGCTQMANEMSILFRHTQAAMRVIDSEFLPAREMASATALLAIRQIISRAFEFRVFSNSVGSASEELLQAGLQARPDLRDDYKRARAAKRQMADLLGEGDNTIAALVRNKVGFHLNRDYLDRAFERVPDDFEFADFHAETRVNIVYGVAETMQMYALAHATGNADPHAAVPEVFDLAGRLVGAVGEYAQGHALAFMSAYIGSDCVSAERPEVPDPGPLADQLFVSPQAELQ